MCYSDVIYNCSTIKTPGHHLQLSCASFALWSRLWRSFWQSLRLCKLHAEQALCVLTELRWFATCTAQHPHAL